MANNIKFQMRIVNSENTDYTQPVTEVDWTDTESSTVVWHSQAVATSSGSDTISISAFASINKLWIENKSSDYACDVTAVTGGTSCAHELGAGEGMLLPEVDVGTDLVITCKTAGQTTLLEYVIVGEYS